MTDTTTLRAPRGTTLRCKGWGQEAALRMLLNNLDEEVAEDQKNLIVYGGSGKAARDWACFEQIVKELERLEDDQTLLIQSGKAVGVFQSHRDAPRVLIANSNLVGKWATWEHFRELERRGLMMYGQMTAGSWIYIGTQGILQGTYETFAAAARAHFGGSLEGRFLLTGGLGGMGGAQPLAATMCGAAFLGVDVDAARIKRRVKTRYLDEMSEDLDEALEKVLNAKARGEALSVGLVGNAAEVFPELARRGVIPDVVTDQTSAHDPLGGYVPPGMTLAQAIALRQSDPERYEQRSLDGMVAHVNAMVAMQDAGAVTFDYGNNLRQYAFDHGAERAFDFPGFVPAYIRPLFCEGSGPFRWVALSGDPQDIYKTDQALRELFPEKTHLLKWLDMARERVAFQGLPARICWLGVRRAR